MPTATLTSKGQVTIPLPVRDRLGLKAGDQVDFVFAPEGGVLLQPKRAPFEKLRGILRSRRKKALGVRAMDRAIQKAVRARWKATARSAAE